MSKVFVRIYNGNLGDRMIWFVLLMLAMASALAVYSTSGSLAYKHDSSAIWYLMQHVVFMLLGFALTYVCAMMNYMKFSKIAPILLIIACVLLVYTLFFGSAINDARRWIRIPIINVTFQTSDFAKLALVIYLARILTTKQDTIKDFKSAFIPIIAPVGLICFLIAPVNLSTAMLLFLTCLAMMFVGRVKSKYMFGMIGAGVLLFGVLVLIWYFFPTHVRVGTWINRIQDFMGDGDGSYQNVQAKIAIANGGVWGKGAGDGDQIHFLPSAYADFIYASICEEYGIIGAIAIMGLFVLFFFRVVKIVTKSPKAFGALLAMGLALLITIQAITNMAVSVNLLPVTGLTLPLVSKGGTSIFFTSIAMGMILSVSRFVDKTTVKSKADEIDTTDNDLGFDASVSVTESTEPFEAVYVLDKKNEGKNTI